MAEPSMMMTERVVCARHLGRTVDNHTPANRIEIELLPTDVWTSRCNTFRCDSAGVYHVTIFKRELARGRKVNL